MGLTLLIPALVAAACSGAGPAGGSPSSGVAPEASSVAPSASQSDATATPACSQLPCYAEPVSTGSIAEVAPEASGIAPSSTDPDLFYVVDDASRTSSIVAVRRNGTVVGEIEVNGMSAANAEALVPGVCWADRPDRCLYVGDIGADPRRAEVTVYRVPEPDSAQLPEALSADAWSYRYPEGEFNAEAMLVDSRGDVLIITKPAAGEPHRVFRGAPGGAALELTTTFLPPEPDRPLQSLLVGNVVTDASAVPDRVLLLTYDQAVEYIAPVSGADPGWFPDWPSRKVPIPRQWQSEGITYLAAAGLPACGFLVVSEQGRVGDSEIGEVSCAF